MFLFAGRDSATGKHQIQPFPMVQEVPTGTVNGSNTDFTLALAPTNAASLLVFLDGLIVPSTLWSINLGTKVLTFTTAPASGQSVYVVYVKD